MARGAGRWTWPRTRQTADEAAEDAALAAKYDAKTLTTTNILRWWCGGVTRQAVEQALNTIRFNDPGLIPWDVEEEKPAAATEPRANKRDAPPKAQKAWKLPADPDVLFQAIRGSKWGEGEVRRLGTKLLKWADTLAKDED